MFPVTHELESCYHSISKSDLDSSTRLMKKDKIFRNMLAFHIAHVYDTWTMAVDVNAISVRMNE